MTLLSSPSGHRVNVLGLNTEKSNKRTKAEFEAVRYSSNGWRLKETSVMPCVGSLRVIETTWSQSPWSSNRQ